MPEVIKCYNQKLPANRFIGKKYGDSDRVGGGFGSQWGEWFNNGWFSIVENLAGDDKSLIENYEDANAYLGYMRWKDGEPFEYWIGMFKPEGTAVPEGFEFIDIPESMLGVGWLYGPESDIYGKEHLCAEKCVENGYKIIPDEKGAYWFFERYVCPRFTSPDDKGNLVLDICHFIEK